MSELLFSVLKAALAKVLSEEVNVSVAACTRWLVARSAGLLIAGQRDRYTEEWLSVLEQRRTPLRKILCAADFWRSAIVMRHERLYPGQAMSERFCVRLIDVSIAAVILLALAPAMLVIAGAIWTFQGFRGPLSSHWRQYSNGNIRICELPLFFRLEDARIPRWFRGCLEATHLCNLPAFYALLIGRTTIAGRHLFAYGSVGPMSDFEVQDVIVAYTSPLYAASEERLIYLSRPPGLAGEYEHLVPGAGIASLRTCWLVIRAVVTRLLGFGP